MVKRQGIGFSESTAERILREEFQRQHQMAETFKSSGLLDSIAQSRSAIAELGKSHAEILQRAKLFDQYKNLDVALDAAKNFHLASSVVQTARQMQLFGPGRALADPDLGQRLAENFRETASLAREAFANPEMFTAAREFAKVAAEMRPHLEIARQFADEIRLVNSLTLRASIGDQLRPLEDQISSQLVEIDAALSTLDESDDAEATPAALVRLFDLLGNFFATVSDNTLGELRSAGLVKFLEIVIALLTAYAYFNPPPGISLEQHAAFSELQRKADQAEKDLAEIKARQEANDTAFLADRPRAYLERRAVVRAADKGDAPVIARLAPQTQLAVMEKKGRWSRVVFRDELSGQLATGWIWTQSLTAIE